MRVLNVPFFRWLTVENRLFWLGAVLPLVVFWLAIRIGWGSELSIRSSGYVLSLVGASTVFVSVFKAQRTFNSKRAAQRLRDHVKRGWSLLSGSRSVTIGASGFAGGMSLGQARPNTISGRRNFDIRIAELEVRVSALDALLAQEVAARAGADQELRGKLQLDRDEREAAVSELRRQLADMAMGDWMIQIAGAFWIVIGQACTTFPAEIARHVPLCVLTWLR